VSASRHPAALGQLAGVRARGIEVVEPPVDARADDADRVLARLAHDAHRSLAADPRIDVLFVIGGDTAAAVLGEAEVDVDGTLDVGGRARRGRARRPSAAADHEAGRVRVGRYRDGRARPGAAMTDHPADGTRPPLAITMGDASGVGPELVVRRAAQCRADGAPELAAVVVYGELADPAPRDPTCWASTRRPSTSRCSRHRRSDGRVPSTSSMPVCSPPPTTAPASSTPPPARRRGSTCSRPPTRRSPVDVAAIVTLPMNKEATQLTDPGFVGHTELIADLLG
jgi:hypothetical protein